MLDCAGFFVTVDNVESQTQYHIDPNGIPIKPGYRKPFNSETGRVAQLRSASVRSENTLAIKIQRDSRVVIEVLKQVRDLLERRKRGQKPHLAGIPDKPSRDYMVTPIGSAKKATIQAGVSDQNASEVKLEGVSGDVSSANTQTDTTHSKT